MRKFLLPLLLFLTFAMENIFSTVVPTSLFVDKSIVAPHFLFIVLLFIVVYYNPLQGILYAMLFGFLVDIVYTELLGIYLFAFPVIAYLASNAMKILQVNLFIVSSLIVISMIALEYYVYGFLSLLGRANLSAAVFFTDRLLPTLLLNVIFLLLFSFPLKNYLLRLHDEIGEK